MESMIELENKRSRGSDGPRRRGPDKAKRKKREYPVSMRMQIKIPKHIFDWINEQAKGWPSRFITGLVEKSILESEKP